MKLICTKLRLLRKLEKGSGNDVSRLKLMDVAICSVTQSTLSNPWSMAITAPTPGTCKRSGSPHSSCSRRGTGTPPWVTAQYRAAATAAIARAVSIDSSTPRKSHVSQLIVCLFMK